MRFAHVSDLHFTSTPQNFEVIRNDVVQAVNTLFVDLQSIEHHLDFIAITGDLAETGDTDSYRKIMNALSTISIPVYVVPGNHDAREPFREIFSHLCPIPKSGSLDFYVETAPVKIIALDTLKEGEVAGRLMEEQIDWLASRLMIDAKHTVLLMHHPPFKTGLSEFDSICILDGYEKFSRLIAESKSNITILSGHVHRPYQALWSGANCYIAGSPAFQIGGDSPFGDCMLDVVDEPFVYSIHTLDENDDHLVHMRYVDLANNEYTR